MPSEVIPGKKQYHLIAGVFIAGFCVFLQLYSPQPLLVVFREYFGESEARVSLIVSSAAFAVALFSPIIGMFADAVGRKRIIVPCIFILSAATFGCALAQNLNQLIFFRFIAGVCTPGVVAVIIAYISEEADNGTAGSVMALYVTGTVLGGLTGRLSAAFIADYFLWRYSFIFLSILTLSGAVSVWLFLPASKKFVIVPEWRNAFPAMIRHLGNRRLTATYITGFNALFCHVGLFTYANFYLSKPPFSLSTSALGLIFLVYALGIVVTPLAGRIIDRIGYRAGAITAICFIAAGALLTLFSSLPMFITGLAVASTGIFIIQASASSHVGHAAEGARSAATGLYVAFYYLGGSAGATALAVPWALGGWKALVAAMILVQCISFVFVWRYFERTCNKSEILPELPGC